MCGTQEPMFQVRTQKVASGGSGLNVETPKSGFQAKLGSLTVLKKDI